MSAATLAVTGKVYAWRHPEWWALTLAAGTWLLMIRTHAGGHAHHTGFMTNWIVMTVAMMLLMVIDPIRYAAQRSVWRRRHRAVAGFLLGYLGCWTLIGLAVSPLAMQDDWTAPVAFALAGAWQLTPWKRRALIACHRTMPLAPRGWRADRDCVRYGVLIGTRCVVSCWALMLACAFSGHALLATAGLTTVGLIERYTPRPDQRILAGALFAVALLYATFR